MKRKELDEEEERDFDYEQAQLLIELSKDVKKQSVPMSKLMTSLVEEAYDSDENFQHDFIFKMIDIWLACKFKKA